MKTNKKSLLRTSAETGQLKWFVIGTLTVSAIGVGGYFYFQNRIKAKIAEKRKEQVEQNSHIEGSIENIAKKIANELEKSWYEDTNQAAVIDAIRQIKSESDYKKLIDIYKKLTGKVLNEEIAKSLTTTEQKVIEDIIYLKPTKEGNTVSEATVRTKANEYADELFKIMDGADWTGSSGVKALRVFQSLPDLRTYKVMEQIYNEKHGNLWEDLGSEVNIRIGYSFEQGKTYYTAIQDIVKNLK
jgi:hypothetical protein